MTAEANERRPQRRAGTFTLGITLAAAGLGMLASWFWPGFHPQWLVNGAPVILVLLGIEVLIAAKGGGRVKYDWAGIILCFLITCAALAMYAAAWWLQANPYGSYSVSNCSRLTNETSYQMSFGYFNGFDSHSMELKSGQVLLGESDIQNGWIEAEIRNEDGETVWEQTLLGGQQQIGISRSGLYTIEVFGRQAGGHFSFTAEPPAPEPAVEKSPAALPSE